MRPACVLMNESGTFNIIVMDADEWFVWEANIASEADALNKILDKSNGLTLAKRPRELKKELRFSGY